MNRAVYLKDIADIITGPFGSQLHESDYVSEGVPSIMPQNIGDRVLDYAGIARITEKDAKRLSRYLVQENDIVYARRGDIEKHAMIRKEDIGSLCGTGCLRVRVTSETVYPYFLSHYLNRSETKKWIVQHAVGSNMPNINTEILGAVPINLPIYGVQKRIADLLDSIDKKIQLNKALCVEMESIAKTLYDYWFVQFDFPDENGKPYRTSGGKMIGNDRTKREIPNRWKDGNLYDIADFVNGLACQKYRPDIGEEGLPVIKIKEMHDGISEDTEFVSMNIPKKYIVEDGDLLFSWSATLETMFWYGGKGGLNQHIFKVVPKAPYPIEYVYEQLSAYIINFVKMAEARKTTMGHITTDHLNQSRIVLPPPDVLEKYSEKVKPIYQKVGQLKKENKVLPQLRDWLLPMLMNGQATVVDKEKEESPTSETAAAPTADPRFTKWLETMGLAARGTVDRQTLLDIFNAMDEDDKQ